MDIRRKEMDGLQALAKVWKATPNAELEAMLIDLDLTSWQDVIQYLRSLGMRDAPQTVKLNICLSNDIRITLTGAGIIQAYCKDNRIADKPFVAMIKEPIQGADPVDLPGYGCRIKLKRETPLAKTDPRLAEVIANWDKLAKHFRNIQRFEFVAPGGLGLRFDISLVRENADRRCAAGALVARLFWLLGVLLAAGGLSDPTASPPLSATKGKSKHLLTGRELQTQQLPMWPNCHE